MNKTSSVIRCWSDGCKQATSLDTKPPMTGQRVETRTNSNQKPIQQTQNITWEFMTVLYTMLLYYTVCSTMVVKKPVIFSGLTMKTRLTSEFWVRLSVSLAACRCRRLEGYPGWKTHQYLVLYIEKREEKCFICSNFKKIGEKYIISTMGRGQIMSLHER